jgi:hypothetical protein
VRLSDLPTGYLFYAVSQNPDTTTFPWGGIEGYIGEVPRAAVLAELERRLDGRVLLRNMHVPQSSPSPNWLKPVKPDLETEQQIAVQQGIQRSVDVVKQATPETFTPAGREQQAITVLLFTSRIPSHPHTWVIDKVYNSIRTQLPLSRIIILADGENGPESPEYSDFKKELGRKGWEVIAFNQKMHQSLMLRHVLMDINLIKTPIVMVGEHDWGFRPRYIDWSGIVKYLRHREEFKLIQFRQDEPGIWEWDHHAFSGEVITTKQRIRLLPTINFQCPTHIADVEWYRNQVITLSEPDFLERSELCRRMIFTGGVNQMACYLPNGPSGRLYHLDGRGVTNFRQLDGIGDS